MSVSVKRTVLFLSLFLVLIGITTLAQTAWERQVAAQIEAIHSRIAADYDYSSDLLIDELAQGEKYSVDLELNGRNEYIIVGVCDTDCGDLDLVIFDHEQEQAAADVERDDYPVLQVQGEGEFELVAIMSDCSAATCAFGLQVFERARY